MFSRVPLLLIARTTILKGGRLVPARTDSLLSVTLTSLQVDRDQTAFGHELEHWGKNRR